MKSIVVEKENAFFDSRDNCNAIINKANNSIISSCQSTIIPKGVTRIEDRAFSKCSNLKLLTTNDVTTIGLMAFYGCHELEVLNISKHLTSIDKDWFYECDGLATIFVDDDNPVYDSRNNCNAIIETSNNNLIMGCKNTIIPNNVTSIDDYAFYQCVGLTSIDIPSNIKSIGFYAFQECTGLTSIKIPTGVTSIEGVFYGCKNLTNVVLPNTITNIGVETFWYCTGMTDMYCYAEEVPKTTFNLSGYEYVGNPFRYSSRKEATLHVPASSVNAYKEAEVWKEFGNIVELTDDDPKPTGIMAVEAASNEDYFIYDLNGVRLSEPKKGINIINGKKYVIQ